MVDADENVEPLRDRVRRRMAAEGVPVGTDDPLLISLGARPFCEVDRCSGNPCLIRVEQPSIPVWLAYERGCASIRHIVDQPSGTPCPSTALSVLGMVGDPAEVRCGLLEGHDGPHRMGMEWTDEVPYSGSQGGDR